MNPIILESLDYEDMEGQLDPIVTVDEYEAKMGKNKDIVTLTFVVHSEAVGNDLVDWFERGYDWVLDASVSEGEIKVGKYLVFVEMNRRSTVPERIIELLLDLKTLTGYKITDWTVQIENEDYDADESVIRQVIICNPNEYKLQKEKENEMNEMREIAGLLTKAIYEDKNKEIKDFVNLSGI